MEAVGGGNGGRGGGHGEETEMEGAEGRGGWRNNYDGMLRMSGGCLEAMVTDKEMGGENADDEWPMGGGEQVGLILHSHWQCP